ncbi:MAG: hypothetical protein NZ581_02650, partial [Candidatus Caldarchaeum sp.]|nr:hypothetical protein [Candidatus Caldarchaeum sp.]MDW8435083.1 hypothetical protein [Candidatus Caldarchaeum sp.]
FCGFHGLWVFRRNRYLVELVSAIMVLLLTVLLFSTRLSFDRKRVEAELRGRSLEVFLYVLRAGKPVGVRDVQRGLGLSSPSVAHHHLEKLHSLGVLQKDEKGSYTAVDKVDVSVLQSFVLLGGKFLPRMAFYAALFTTFTILYLLTHLDAPDPYALSLGVVASAATIYEAVRTWRKRPF